MSKEMENFKRNVVVMSQPLIQMATSILCFCFCFSFNSHFNQMSHSFILIRVPT